MARALLNKTVDRGVKQVLKLKAREVVSVRVKLPRNVWPNELQPSDSNTEVRLIRGRWTSRQAVLRVLVEGQPREIQDALRSWERRGFSVEQEAGLVPVLAI